MAQLPPELQKRLDALAAELEERWATMQPLDPEAELARINARLAQRPSDMEAFRADLNRRTDEQRRHAEKAARWSDWAVAAVIVAALVVCSVAVALVMFVAVRMPAGQHDDVPLLLISSLFVLVLAILAARR